jgi:glutamate--cysteine ligase
MAGLYYDPDALRAAEALTQGWTDEDRQKLRDDVPALGLAAKVRGRDLRAVALDVLAIAHGGLKRRARLNKKGEDETLYLRPLQTIAESSLEAARRWIGRYDGAWGRSVEPAFEEAAF